LKKEFLKMKKFLLCMDTASSIAWRKVDVSYHEP
jgi:hypothetical protein